MIELPKVVVVGNVEFFFAGAALALGFPKLARKALAQRYGSSEKGDDTTDGGA